MLEYLNNLDQNLFFGINDGMSNPFFDWILPHLRNRFTWVPLYLFLAIFLVRNYGRNGWVILLGLCLTFALADFASSSILKPAFERLRPCNNPEIKDEVNNLIACGTGFSFPSSHASNHFAIALFLIVIFYKKWHPILPLALFWAFTVSFAQIYTGVHYPGDILFGGIVGGLIGFGISTFILASTYFKEWQSEI